ncbi:MAG TPA: hypothetical protein VIL46_06065, partial [Gemmataceae bacterium]
MRHSVTACGLAALLFAVGARAAEPVDVEETIERGLRWLANTQNKNDGHWEANGGQYPTTMTALAGMCFLMEGSTVREGRYRENLIRA